MYIYYDLFIQSTVGGHLGCLHLRLLYQSCSENVCVSFQGEVSKKISTIWTKIGILGP